MSTVYSGRSPQRRPRCISISRYSNSTRPGPDEVLVGIVNAGLCHSDLHEIDGTFETDPPILLGHEAAGIVEMVGENVRDIKVGDHVVSCLSVFCGQCRYCTNGHLSLCVHRNELSHSRPRPRLVNEAGVAVRPTAGIGAFAEAMTVHRNAVAVIPDDVPLATASILGCAVTTGLGAVFRSARVQAGSTVAVIGTGGVGMMAIQGARIAGAAKIIAIDVVPSKLERCLAVRRHRRRRRPRRMIRSVPSTSLTGRWGRLQLRGGGSRSDGGTGIFDARARRGRHGDRDDPGRDTDRDPRVGTVPAGEEAARLVHGVQPVQDRHPALRRALQAGTSDAGRNDQRTA